jgi:uncharacterized membrane protein
MSRVLLLAGVCLLIGSIAPSARAQSVETNLVPGSALAPVPISDVASPEDAPAPDPEPEASPPAPMPTPIPVGSGRVGISATPAPARSAKPQNTDPTSSFDSGEHHSPGVVWMIVGGAALLVGILIDQPVITIAGALVGLYGLYLAVR